MHRSSPAQSVRGTPRRARTALADNATPLASPVGSPVAPKPPTTFISSLEIPVQGAVPIPQPPGSAKSSPLSSAAPPPPPAPTTSTSSSTTASSGRRAPRRSKTEALAALQHAVHADGADDAPPPAPTLFHPDAAPLPAAPRLDMTTVRRPNRSRRVPTSPQVTQKERPFALQDCPAFYPTPEEFRDPMSYIRAIIPKAQEFGIAKIIPPETWRMPFVTDTEVGEIFFIVIMVQKGGEHWAYDIVCRNLGSRHGCSALIPLRRHPEQRSTFWSNCIGFISSRATPECLYPRSITNLWICGFYGRKCENWVAMTR
jgi:[histone H3]-trimethyl-L-lysine4 demethylase